MRPENTRPDIIHPAECRCGQCGERPGDAETMLAVAAVAAVIFAIAFGAAPDRLIAWIGALFA